MRMLGLSAGVALLAGCGHDYSDISSSVSRDTSPSSADVAVLASGEADFAFDLYRAQVAGDTSSNVFYSPYSISVALAMTYAGAGGATATEIASAMHFTLPPDRLHTAFDAVDLALGTRQGVKLDVANSVWGERTLSYGQAFLDTLAADYGSEVRGVDFIHESTQAESDINGWVSDQTSGKIPNLFSPGSLDSTTRVVLVDAVYFDATWQTTFDSSLTAPAPFTKLDGTAVTAPLMHIGSVKAATAQQPTYVAVDVPYAGGQTSMLVVMPTQDQYANVEAGLGGDFFAGVVAALSPPQDVALTLPKFTIQGGSVSLKEALTSLGMVAAFDPASADLSPMVTSEPTYVRDVVHQAYVRVDESGTEAAAATGVSTGIAAVEEPPQVVIDHPFFFFIRDIPTGELLFVGRVVDPTK